MQEKSVITTAAGISIGDNRSGIAKILKKLQLHLVKAVIRWMPVQNRG